MSSSQIRKIKQYFGKGKKKIDKQNSIPNKYEQSAYDFLTLHNLNFIREYQIPNTTKFFDIYIPDQHLLIELDGDYWHPLTMNEAKTKIQKHNYKNDIYKNKLAFNHGFKLIRVRQSEGFESILNYIK